jgi:hypothetical protein
MTKKTHANGGNDYNFFEKDHETYYLPLKKSFQDYIAISLDLVPWFEVLDKCIQLILVLVLLVTFKVHHDSMNRSISSWKLSKFVQHIIVTTFGIHPTILQQASNSNSNSLSFICISISLARLVSCQMQLE